MINSEVNIFKLYAEAKFPLNSFFSGNGTYFITETFTAVLDLDLL